MKKETKIYGWYGEPNDPTEYTAGEREKFFKQEGEAWRQWFFDCLAKHGKVVTRFCVYTLKNETPFS